jgi:hypothetical protein
MRRRVIVIAPFREVVGKLQARRVCVCIFKVNHDKLFMFIRRKE